jgi:hypothetical protein
MEEREEGSNQRGQEDLEDDGEEEPEKQTQNDAGGTDRRSKQCKPPLSVVDIGPPFTKI